MGKRLCLTFSVYYFVHPYNITALMICQHVFWTFTFFTERSLLRTEWTVTKALCSPYCISNISCIFMRYYKGFSTIHNNTASSWNGRLTNHYIHSFWIIIDTVVSGILLLKQPAVGGESCLQDSPLCDCWNYHSLELSSEAGDFIRSMSVKCTI